VRCTIKLSTTDGMEVWRVVSSVLESWLGNSVTYTPQHADIY
jgi:hypothetical protein